MLKKLKIVDKKFRQYYFKMQKSLNHFYDKIVFLQFFKKNQIFQNAN